VIKPANGYDWYARSADECDPIGRASSAMGCDQSEKQREFPLMVVIRTCAGAIIPLFFNSANRCDLSPLTGMRECLSADGCDNVVE
jgi:hypothetical protein